MWTATTAILSLANDATVRQPENRIAADCVVKGSSCRWDQWGVAELEAAAALPPGTGRDLVKALQTEGLIEASARGAWSVTQAGRRFSVASAARPVTRATAEKALAEFLDRVEQVNRDSYFLGKAVRVVLFGSMLKPEVMRLSDVDLAVELVTKEADFDRAREQNYRRAEELAEKGKQFRNVLDWELCWYFETQHFLKGGSRVIAMADYRAENFDGGKPVRHSSAPGEFCFMLLERNRSRNGHGGNNYPRQCNRV
jgi:predicted nucleotidyltransferase